LDNAGKRKFDVDNERIELAAAFILWVHDATRNRLVATMSRRLLVVQFCLTIRIHLGCALCQIRHSRQHREDRRFTLSYSCD
jgi:hypothetical protein